jgi:glycosyltransferase involved in cell wall biosynthesis
MKVAVIDHRANVGGGRRFTSSLVKALVDVCPSCSIRLVATREAIDKKWFGDFTGVPFETSGIVTEQTTRQWLPDGRTWGIPGTWRVKAGIRSILLRGHFQFDRQLDRALDGIDLAYFGWPYFIDYRDFGIPVVSTLHDLIWKYIDGSTAQDKAMLDTHVPQWLAGSAAVVTSTNFMRGEIEKFYPHWAKRIEVVHLPANDLPAPIEGAERKQLLSRWNIQTPFAFCPAGLWVHKNHKNLILAFARLKEKHADLQLVCTGMYTDHAFGSNPPRELWKPAEELRQITLNAGLIPGQDIIGLGHVSDVELATLYSAASCVVMPVIYEAGSFPILEGAAQGVPIACSDIPVYREQDETYGLQPVYFDPYQPDSIADAISQLVRAQPSAEKLDEIERRVRARTWHDVAREYLQVFESVI